MVLTLKKQIHKYFFNYYFTTIIKSLQMKLLVRN